jgi:hypothetical protein
LRHSYVRSLESLAEAAEQRREWSSAVERWRTLVAEERYNARVTLRLMRALDGAGDRAGALQQARVHTLLLQLEFEAEPDPDVVALADRLRTEPANGDDRKAAAWSADTGSNGGSPRAGISASDRVTSDRLASTADLAPALDELPSATPSPGPPLPRVLRRRWVISGIIGLLVLGAIAAIRHTDRPSLDQDLIAVAPFDVFDPKLDLWREGLVDILSRDLDGAGPLRAVSPRVAIRRWIGRAEPAEANALGRRTGAGLAVFGSWWKAGLIRCDSQRPSSMWAATDRWVRSIFATPWRTWTDWLIPLRWPCSVLSDAIDPLERSDRPRSAEPPSRRSKSSSAASSSTGEALGTLPWPIMKLRSPWTVRSLSPIAGCSSVHRQHTPPTHPRRTPSVPRHSTEDFPHATAS